MDPEIKHEDKMHMHEMHKGHHRPWQSNWKSPVSIGIFLLAVSIAFAAVPIGLESFIALSQQLHPQASQGMTPQEMQQLEQQMPASDSGAPAAPGAGATTGQ